VPQHVNSSEIALDTSDVDPVETLLLTSSAFVIARCLHAVTEVGVADALQETPEPVACLASATATHPGVLGRLLRLLATRGIFELRDGTVRHTPSSRLLRSDHPQSMRAIVEWLGSPILRASFDAIQHSLATGLPSAEQVAAGGIWKYLAEHPAESRLFEDAMRGKSYGQIARVLGHYDFASFGVIGDIGGGHGHLLQAALETAPSATGVLFELPHVIDQVAGIASNRLRLQSGDFFVDALPTCDAYVLMQVLHDWSDAEAISILAGIRRAAGADARLLIVEILVPDDLEQSFATVLDVYMLAHGGQERTERQYTQLLNAAGFDHRRTLNIGGDEAILEATPRPG
jgi:hypothetical protein